MIDFVRKNIQKKKRNGELLVSSSNNFGSNTTSKGSNFTGSFLPAISNGDGSYTVDASKVTFRGSVIGEKEVTAYGVSSALPEGGDGTGTTDYNKLKNKPALNGEELTSLSKLKTINKQSLLGEGDITLEGIGSGKVADNLTTKDPTIALSANQGVVLKDLIDKKTIDTSKYYDKTSIDTLLNDKAAKTHTHTKSDITDLNTKPYDEHIANNDIHVKSSDKTYWNNKLDKSIWEQAFYFDDKNNLRVRKNLIGNGEITAYAGSSGGSGSGGLISTDYNDLINKPAINGTELTSTTKFKTINGQQLIGDGDIIISSGGSGSGGIGTSNYNELSHKPKLNGIILNEESKLKTINGQSLIGDGNIEIKIEGGSGGSQPSIGTTNYNDLTNKPKINGSEMIGNTRIRSIGGKLLVNYIGSDDISIKTINGNSIFGTGDIQISAGSIGSTNYNDLTNKPTLGGFELIGDTKLKTINGSSLVGIGDIKFKTINGNSLIGTGDIKVESSNSGGTKNYNDLTNKPALNGFELMSNSKIRSIGGKPLVNYLGNDDIPIKTINGHSIFGEGDLLVEAQFPDGSLDAFVRNYNNLDNKPTINGFELIGNTKIRSIGGNRLTGYIGNDDIPIKTINGHSIFGEGDIKVEAEIPGGSMDAYLNDYDRLRNKPQINGMELIANTKLRSIGGQRLIHYLGNDDIPLKTINGHSIIGEGDIKIQGGSGGGSSSGMGQYGFEIVDGFLVLVTEEQQSVNPFTIDNDGYLVYEING